MPAVPVVYDRLQDLTDVAFVSLARGDLPYRGASAWNNLPPGTAGQVLQTNGVGADPSWATPAADLSPTVILAPATSARNAIQGTALEVTALAVRALAGQTAPLFEAQDSGAVARLTIGSLTAVANHTLALRAITSQTGMFLQLQNAAGTALSGFSALGHFVNAAGTMVIGVSVGNQFAQAGNGLVANCRTAAVPGLVVAAAASQTGTTVECRDVGGVARVIVGSLTDVATTTLALRAITSQTGLLTEWRASDNVGLTAITAIGAVLCRPRDAATNAITDSLTLGHNTSGTPAAGFGSQLCGQLESSTTEDRDALDLSWEWATATDASRKARGKLLVFDTAAREALRVEASGTAPMIGVLGAAAAARQVVNAAAADPATTMALVNQLRAALVTFGFCA